MGLNIVDINVFCSPFTKVFVNFCNVHFYVFDAFKNIFQRF